MSPPGKRKWGGQKFFFARSAREIGNCPPHLQNRGAAPGPEPKNVQSRVLKNGPWPCLGRSASKNGSKHFNLHPPPPPPRQTTQPQNDGLTRCQVIKLETGNFEAAAR